MMSFMLDAPSISIWGAAGIECQIRWPRYSF